MLNDLKHLCLGLEAATVGANVHKHTVAVECVHRIAFGNKNSLIRIVDYHAVLAIAAAHKHPLAGGAALLGFKLPRTHLRQKAVECQLLKNLHHIGAALGG